MTLGESITRLRTQKGWSQGDLADALDVSRQSISKWETDTSVPELEKLIRLSELFGVTLDALVRGERAETQTENAAHAAPPQSAPTSPAPAVSHTHTVAGVILLCFFCCSAADLRVCSMPLRSCCAPSSSLRQSVMSVSGAAGRSLSVLTFICATPRD